MLQKSSTGIKIVLYVKLFSVHMCVVTNAMMQLTLPLYQHQVGAVNSNKHKNIYKTHAVQGKNNINIWGV